MKGQLTTLVAAEIDPDDRQAAVRDFLATTDAARRNIVYVAALDRSGPDVQPDFEAARSHGWGGVLDLLHVLADLSSEDVGRTKELRPGTNGTASSAAATNGAAHLSGTKYNLIHVHKSNGTAPNGTEGEREDHRHGNDAVSSSTAWRRTARRANWQEPRPHPYELESNGHSGHGAESEFEGT